MEAVTIESVYNQLQLRMDYRCKLTCSICGHAEELDVCSVADYTLADSATAESMSKEIVRHYLDQALRHNGWAAAPLLPTFDLEGVEQRGPFTIAVCPQCRIEVFKGEIDGKPDR